MDALDDDIAVATTAIMAAVAQMDQDADDSLRLQQAFLLAAAATDGEGEHRTRRALFHDVPRPLLGARLTDDGLHAWYESHPDRFIQHFCFQIPEMERVLDALAFGQELRLPRDRGGYRATRLEAFAMYLRHLAHPVTQESNISDDFGCSKARVSAVVTYFGQIMHHHVSEGMVWPKTDVMIARVPLYARTLQRLGNIFYPRVFGFLVATENPAPECPNDRHKRHSIKFQGMVTPDGIVRHFYAPFGGSRHDEMILNESLLHRVHLAEMNARLDLDEIHEGEEEQAEHYQGRPYIVYADKVFINYRYIGHDVPKPPGAELPEHLQAMNCKMNELRQMAKVPYMLHRKLFGQLYLRDWQKSRVDVTNAMFLSNCMTCLRGGSKILNYVAQRLDDDDPGPVQELIAAEELEHYVASVTGFASVAQVGNLLCLYVSLSFFSFLAGPMDVLLTHPAQSTSSTVGPLGVALGGGPPGMPPALPSA